MNEEREHQDSETTRAGQINNYMPSSAWVLVLVPARPRPISMAQSLCLSSFECHPKKAMKPSMPRAVEPGEPATQQGADPQCETRDSGSRPISSLRQVGSFGLAAGAILACSTVREPCQRGREAPEAFGEFMARQVCVPWAVGVYLRQVANQGLGLGHEVLAVV